MDNQIKLLIIGEENSLYSTIKEGLHEYNFSFLHIENYRSELKRQDASLVIILRNTVELGIDTIQKIEDEMQALPILFVSEVQDFQLLRDVTRAGAVDYIVIPDEINILTNRIQDYTVNHINIKKDLSPTGFKRGGGQVMAFYSGKGGSGKTFLSSTFAQTLKLESTAQVIYIDFNLQFGGAETFLGIESNRALTDLNPVIHEINEHHIRNVSEKEPYSKLEVLISPKDAELAETIDEDYVIKLIRACKRSYDFIIIDMPTIIDERSYATLLEVDKIYYVMNLDTPSIKVLKHVEELFRRLDISLDDRIEIVVNGTSKDNELTKKDLERFVKYPIISQIRRDHKGIQSTVNQGQPIRKETKEKNLLLQLKMYKMGNFYA